MNLSTRTTTIELTIPYAPIDSKYLITTKPMGGRHPQEAFHRARGKVFYRAVLAGTGSGKTACGTFELIRNAVENPDTAWAAFEPTFPMVRQIMMPSLKSLLGHDIKSSPIVSKWNEQQSTLELVNGSVVFFGSMEYPERAEGPNLDGVWIDEPRLIRKWTGDDGAFNVIDRRLRGSKSGREPVGMWLTSSAPTRAMHDQFERRDSPEYLGDEARVYRWTTMENPHVPDRYRANMAKKYRGIAYDRYVLGKYGTSEGLIIEGFDPTKEEFVGEIVEWDRVTGGIDWGWSDPAAIVLCFWLGDRYQLREYLYGSRIAEETIIEEAVRLTKEHGVSSWRAGHDRPESIGKLRTEGLNIEARKSRVEERFSWLAEASQTGRFKVHLESLNLIAEAETLEKDPDKDCYPLPGQDHGLDASCYAVEAGMNPVAPASTVGNLIKPSPPAKTRIGADRRGSTVGRTSIRDSVGRRR